jgi:hypothetical protein
VKVAAGILLALLAAAGVVGCGADSHLQAQESAVLIRTCQSLYERDHGVVPPPLPPDFLRSWLRNAPRGFADKSTRDQFRAECDLLPTPTPRIFNP